MQREVWKGGHATPRFWVHCHSSQPVTQGLGCCFGCSMAWELRTSTLQVKNFDKGIQVAGQRFFAHWTTRGTFATCINLNHYQIRFNWRGTICTILRTIGAPWTFNSYNAGLPADLGAATAWSKWPMHIGGMTTLMLGTGSIWSSSRTIKILCSVEVTKSWLTILWTIGLDEQRRTTGK